VPLLLLLTLCCWDSMLRRPTGLAPTAWVLQDRLGWWWLRLAPKVWEEVLQSRNNSRQQQQQDSNMLFSASLCVYAGLLIASKDSCSRQN
jgi:hypothetical protein